MPCDASKNALGCVFTPGRQFDGAVVEAFLAALDGERAALDVPAAPALTSDA